MPVLAPKAVSRCPRCTNPIEIRAVIEEIGRDPIGNRIWAHEGCKTPAEVAAANAKRPTAKRPTAHITPVVAEPEPQPTSTPSVASGDPVSVSVAESIIAGLFNSASAGFTREVQGKVVGELNPQIAALQADARTKLREMEEALVDAIQQGRESIREDLIGLARMTQKVQIQITLGDNTKAASSSEVFNRVFSECLDLVSSGENVFLPGPTGCGKTHLAEQIARYIPNDDGTFGRQFGMITGSGGVTETEVKGVAIPNVTTGENAYIPTRFLELYENGGVFLWDEADATDPNVLIVINSAISNGYMSIPKRTDKPMAYRHKDFVILFAANTYGNGADRVYVGRNKLDGATMDRFTYVPVAYDERIERSLCPEHSLYAMLMLWRKRIEDGRLTRILSTRFVAFAFRWRAKGVSYIARKLTLDRGWTADEMRKVIGQDLVDTIRREYEGVEI